MKKDWKIHEVILIIIAILLISSVICSFIGVISLTNNIIGVFLFTFYIMIAFLFYKENKVFSLMFVFVAIISSISYFL
ncbi:hypothetical protein BU075_03360 [Mammaliicoccus vitulinus]|nr:hypothetical protein BU075_03360 [Mammaliicoccus vitulinus]